MNTLIAHDEQPKVFFEKYDKACPYSGINVCMASFSLMAIDTKRRIAAIQTTMIIVRCFFRRY